MLNLLIFTGIFSMVFLSGPSVYGQTASEKETTEQKQPEGGGNTAFIEKYNLSKLPGRSLHTFTQNDFRNQRLNTDPDLNALFTPEYTADIFSKTQDVYKLEIETARKGISSDKEMAQYMEDSSLLKECGMDKSAALIALENADAHKQLMESLAEYTRYYALTPPETPVKLLSEFGPQSAVYVSWPIYDAPVWGNTANLVKEIRTVAQTWIFVPNEYWQKAVALYLTRKGIKLENVMFLYIPANDVWARNWGELTVLCGKEQTPAFIRSPLIGYAGGQPYAKRSSEAVAAFGQYVDVPVYQLPLMIEQGGNIVTDGNGTIVTTQHALDQNPDTGPELFRKILDDYYGCKQLIVTPNAPREVCGHVDMTVKFADEQTVFVASAPEGSLWYDALEETAEIISSYKSLTTGKNFKVIKIPIPSNQVLGQDLKDWSYINSLTVNKKIIVPLYGAPEDKKAIEIYSKILPDHEVVGVNYSAYFFGAIHCQTQNVPVEVTKQK